MSAVPTAEMPPPGAPPAQSQYEQFFQQPGRPPQEHEQWTPGTGEAQQGFIPPMEQQHQANQIHAAAAQLQPHRTPGAAPQPYMQLQTQQHYLLPTDPQQMPGMAQGFPELNPNNVQLVPQQAAQAAQPGGLHVSVPDQPQPQVPVQPASGIPMAQAPPVPVHQAPQPQQPAAPPPVSFQLPGSGVQVQMSPEEIAQMYAQNAALKDKAAAFDDFESWSRANPVGAQSVRAIINGQPPSQVPAPGVTAPATPGAPVTPPADPPDESFLTEENRPLWDRIQRQDQTLAARQGQLASYHQQDEARRREDFERAEFDRLKGRVTSALDSHPYTKAADPDTRNMVQDLAIIASKRWAHEGVTLEAAIADYANKFEQKHRAALGHQHQQLTTQPAVPPAMGSAGHVVPQPAPPPPQQMQGGMFDSGAFASGIQRHLQAAAQQEAARLAQ